MTARVMIAAAALTLLVAGACSDNLVVFAPDGPKNQSWVIVSLRNETSESFTPNSVPPYVAEVGETVPAGRFPSNLPLPDGTYVLLSRGETTVKLAYDILRYPTKWGDTRDVFITIREPEPGTFTAHPQDTSWIRIRSIEVL